MVDFNPTISIISLNISGLNTNIAGVIKTQNAILCCLEETHFKYKDIHLKVKRWRKITMPIPIKRQWE